MFRVVCALVERLKQITKHLSVYQTHLVVKYLPLQREEALSEGINRKHQVLCRQTADGTEGVLGFVGRSGVTSALTL